jgi:hypothetical protein
MFLLFANIISSVGSVGYLSQRPPLPAGLCHPKPLVSSKGRRVSSTHQLNE